MRWLCIYCNEVFEVCHVPADWKDEAEKKRTTQDDVERGFHLIVRPWNEAIRPTENNDRRSALGASMITLRRSFALIKRKLKLLQISMSDFVLFMIIISGLSLS